MLQLFYDSRHCVIISEDLSFVYHRLILGQTRLGLGRGQIWAVLSSVISHQSTIYAVLWFGEYQQRIECGVGITNECGHVTQSGYLTRVTSNEWKPKWSTKLPHSQSQRNQWDIYCPFIALFAMKKKDITSDFPGKKTSHGDCPPFSHLSLNMDLEYLESNILRETKLISEFIKSGHRRINQAQIWSW